jgi:hypothetical protein
MNVTPEIERAAMKIAVDFILSNYPSDVDIMDIPTLVEYTDQRVLVWEPFVLGGRRGIEVAETIYQLQGQILSMVESI